MVYYVVNYEQEEERLQSQYASSKQKGILPQSNYQDKYKHLIGETSAKEAAQSTQTNRSYGFGMYSKPVTYMYIIVARPSSNILESEGGLEKSGQRITAWHQEAC